MGGNNESDEDDGVRASRTKSLDMNLIRTPPPGLLGQFKASQKKGSARLDAAMTSPRRTKAELDEDIARNSAALQTIRLRRNAARAANSSPRRSGRQTRASRRLIDDDDFGGATQEEIKRTMDGVEYAYLSLKEVPASQKEAMASDEANKWRDAEETGMKAMVDNGTWRVVPPKAGIKAIKCHWV
ncbi:hypothetical protein Ae201684P_010370 [Aphanomyces euteiches]|nr:hypothetical protein Ae201684P_010370 [Aphanomyces euteiches]